MHPRWVGEGPPPPLGGGPSGACGYGCSCQQTVLVGFSAASFDTRPTGTFAVMHQRWVGEGLVCDAMGVAAAYGLASAWLAKSRSEVAITPLPGQLELCQGLFPPRPCTPSPKRLPTGTSASMHPRRIWGWCGKSIIWGMCLWAGAAAYSLLLMLHGLGHAFVEDVNTPGLWAPWYLPGSLHALTLDSNVPASHLRTTINRNMMF